MLTKDPELRISAEQALLDAWVIESNKKLDPHAEFQKPVMLDIL